MDCLLIQQSDAHVMQVTTDVHVLQRGKRGVKLFEPGNKLWEETKHCAALFQAQSNFLMEQEILLDRPQL